MRRSLLWGMLGSGLLGLGVMNGCGSSEGGSDPSTDGGSSGGGDTGTTPTDSGGSSSGDSGTADASPACTGGKTSCNGACVDTTSDPSNCGACGTKCGAEQACASSVCTNLCPTPAPDPAFTASATTFYPKIAYTFTPAAGSGVTYTWTFPSGTPATSTAKEPSVTWAAPGTYAVKLEITSGKCVRSSTLDVTVAPCTGSQTFEYTGAAQTFVVTCATSIVVEALGAAGGEGTLQAGGPAAGGLGGRALATIPVTPGETLNVFVGGQGKSIDMNPSPGAGTGGFNGGGDVFDFATPPGQSEGVSGSGGGASDVRRGLTLADRLIVAGGGGGGGYYGIGGAGGGLVGADGNSSEASMPAGKGGTQAAGGAAGWTGVNYPNQPGALGVGGNAYRDGAGNGGGGGGYYGGGAGGFCGGAGGSSWFAAVGNTNGSTDPGVRAGNGRVVVTW